MQDSRVKGVAPFRSFNWMLLYFAAFFVLAILVRRGLSSLGLPFIVAVPGSAALAAVACFPVARRAFSPSLSSWVAVHLGIAVLAAAVLWLIR